MNFKEVKLAQSRAYAPYSNFKVGAAILMKDGSYVYGCNVENASYGLSNCAERSALFSLISQGKNPKDIVSITVIGDTDKPISPCGACRQVMYELLPKDAKVILTNQKGEVLEMTPDSLLPYGFDLKER
ncbi:MAG TPA: cytidine deaminase [Acholeplasma sp.]|nr:cytidine deaminase [Acholeplasma sp.]